MANRSTADTQMGRSPEDFSNHTKPSENLVTHGLNQVTKITFSRSIKSVTHNFHSGQYAVLFADGKVEIYLKDGSQEKLKPNEELEGIVYASKSKIYVGWDKEGVLKLFTHAFDHISDVMSQSNINIVKYNEFKNEIISTTHGKITIWKFTLNNSLVVPMFVIKDFLYPDLPVNVIAIEPTSSRMQRMFVAVKSEVLVFRLQDGQFISKLPDAHKRDITDLVFYQPLQVLLTSAADGSIKLWDETYNVRSVFVGHTDSVNCLSVSQQGPFALSGSADGSIRLWNIDSNEEVQCIVIGMAVAGICRKIGENDFYTYTKKSISFWRINNVYSVFTIIGSKAKMLKTTTHSTVPSLSYYVCEDACIRIACPKTGNIVCVMMSPEWKRIKDAICVPTEGRLFVLLRDGVILNCSIEENPCKIDETWTPEHSGAKSICTTLCLFECFEERSSGGDWRDSITPDESHSTKQNQTESSQKMQNKPFKTLLIGGCEDGKLVVYKWEEGSDSGKISFSIEGHRDRIVALASNNELKQLASCSTDNAVRIWRIYPFTEGTLFPLMFILNTEPATHLVYSRTHLCVALQDASTATYNITIFKISDSEPERLEHSTDDDHQDSIIALCNCPKLNIFASASVDGTIKVWNESNSIIGVVKLHSKPSGMCFSTEKGDLLIAIGEHVHKIPYEKYLPEKMVQHMAVLPFNRLQDISPIMVDKDVLAAMDIDQKHRLQKARSSELFLAKFVDIIPLDEWEDRKLKKAQKDLAVSVLKKRDHDLEQIQNGKLTVKKRAVSPSVREEAWKKYLDLFYTRKPIPPIGAKDDSDGDDDDDENGYRPKERSDKFFSERGNTGFFSISTDVSNIKRLTAELKEKEKEKTEDRNVEPESLPSFKSEQNFPLRETARPLSVGLRPDIYHNPPYSLLRRILSAPPKIRVPELTINRKSMVKYLKPIDVPKASDFPQNTLTIRNINRETAADADNHQGLFNENREAMGMLPIAPDGYLPNSIIVALYKELKKTTPVEEKDEDWKPKALTEEQLEELEENEKRKKRKAQSFNQLADAERRRRNVFKRFSIFSMSSRADSEINVDTPPPTPPPSPPHAEEEPPEKPKEIKPLKPIEKLVSIPIIEKPPTPPPREPTPPPPRPQTPLPRFITQFKGQEWFEKFFPDVEPEMFPRPWTVEGFLQILLDLVKKPFDFDTRVHILAAILILQRQGLFTEEAATVVQYSLLALLKEPLSCSSDELDSKHQFLKLCLTLLTSLELFDEQFIIELMTQYITSDIDLRQHVIQILRHEVGLLDPHDYFFKELDTFTTYGIFDNFKKKQEVYQQCREWIDNWKQLFKKHIISLRGKIYRAKKGNVVRGTKSSKANLKGILKKEQEGISPQSSDRKISFMPNDFINDAAEGVGPIDTINYFCEVEYERELERARAASVAPPKEVIQTEKLRDSVILLPKIQNYRSLARLGETHQSCCHPERETILAYDMRLPSFRQSKNNSLQRGLLLRLQPITLNPFPNLLDELLYEPHANSQLVTLRSAPKYFVPARSYVQNLQI